MMEFLDKIFLMTDFLDDGISGQDFSDVGDSGDLVGGGPLLCL